MCVQQASFVSSSITTSFHVSRNKKSACRLEEGGNIARAALRSPVAPGCDAPQVVAVSKGCQPCKQAFPLAGDAWSREVVMASAV